MSGCGDDQQLLPASLGRHIPDKHIYLNTYILRHDARRNLRYQTRDLEVKI